MHTIFRKLLTLLLCAIMVVSIFAACGKSPADDPVDPTYDHSLTSGVIVLNAGAILSIRYDVQGNVDGISGDNDHGLVIMDGYTGYEGSAVTDVIKKLIELSAAKEALTEDISTVLIKISSGNVFNSEEKRNELVKVAQDALTQVSSKAIPMIIDEENLTGEGYLTLATVKSLLMNKLGVEKFDAFYGDTLPANNYYVVTVELDGVQSSYTIDAYHGFIAVATAEDLLGNTEEDFEDEEEFEEEEEYEDDTDFAEDPVGNKPVAEEENDIEIPIG